MELQVNISDLLKVDEDGFVCFSGRDYLKQLKPHLQDKALTVLTKIINTLGERSAIAQKLKQIITNSIKFYSTDQRIYVKVSGSKALGFVKVGEKKLFYHHFLGSIKELYPTSVLDIYVHESCQRSGIGKQIFEKFLTTEKKSPEKLAYDRPSQKLMSFLKKHYNLSSYIPQNNNFVIFDRFFEKPKPHTTQTHKQRNQTVLEKTSLNSSKFNIEEEDSLNKFTREMNNMAFQQVSSMKEVKDQAKSSFGCPWATEDKITFRTTSNTYGNYYKRR